MCIAGCRISCGAFRREYRESGKTSFLAFLMEGLGRRVEVVFGPGIGMCGAKTQRRVSGSLGLIRCESVRIPPKHVHECLRDIFVCLHSTRSFLATFASASTQGCQAQSNSNRSTRQYVHVSISIHGNGASRGMGDKRTLHVDEWCLQTSFRSFVHWYHYIRVVCGLHNLTSWRKDYLSTIR